MTSAASPRLHAYGALSAAGLLGALVLRRPELAVLAAPFALALAVGLARSRPPDVRAFLELERARALEGDELVVEVELSCERPVERLEVFVALPEGLEVVEGENPVAVRLGWDDERTLELRVRCARWGAYVFGDVFLRARDRLGLLVWEQRVSRETTLRVYPHPQRLRSLVTATETQPFAGNEVARVKGDGLEFADIRPFVAGDRLRAINWRASARLGDLHVNEYHPERNTDVILFLDSFAEARRLDESTLDLAVRAAATLAERYLARRDRVGLVSFGGLLRWLTPGMGRAQLYRIVDALLETEIVFNYAWKDVRFIPPRTLPPQALILALSPLLDPRGTAALADLRGRGYDLAIVDVSPVRFVEPGASEADRLAYRLWLLRREAIRARYQRLGVAVAAWTEETSFDAAIEGVIAFRRHARLARA